MKTKEETTWISGIRVITKEEPIWKFLVPIEIGNNKSPHFEKCYYWLFWYFYKVRRCERCGKLACGKGLIRLMNNSKTKTMLYLCKDCSKDIAVLKNQARKYCNKCDRSCIITKKSFCERKQG
ncbi:MAG TPA: hypothetical protein DCW90_03320 [Lachnospiraceae bacterium]|nr:hypothetical protein [Lachnospiraceae bacterium]